MDGSKQGRQQWHSSSRCQELAATQSPPPNSTSDNALPSEPILPSVALTGYHFNVIPFVSIAICMTGGRHNRPRASSTARCVQFHFGIAILRNGNPSSRHHPSPKEHKAHSATADVPSDTAAQPLSAKSYQRRSSSHPASFCIFDQKSTSSTARKPLPRAIFPFKNTIQSSHTPADSIYERATMLRHKKTQYTLIHWISPGHNILFRCDWAAYASFPSIRLSLIFVFNNQPSH